MVRSAWTERIKKKRYYEENRTRILLKNREKYYSDPVKKEARRKREAKKLWTVEERREDFRQKYYANREAIKAAARRRYAAKKQAKLLSQKNDELSEALINPETEYQGDPLTSPIRTDLDGEGSDKTVPKPETESGQPGTSSGTRKRRTVEERREAGRQRYAANREAIKAAARRRYAAKKQAKLLSQKNNESSEIEDQGGLLTSRRGKDRGKGDKTVHQLVSESGQTGTSSGIRMSEDNQSFNSTLQLPSPDGVGVTSHTLEIDPSALQDYFESTSFVNGCPCSDVECSPKNIQDQSENEDIITSKWSAQCTSTTNDSGEEKAEVEERGLELSKYYFSKLNNLPPPTILTRVGTMQQ